MCVRLEDSAHLLLDFSKVKHLQLSAFADDIKSAHTHEATRDRATRRQSPHKLSAYIAENTACCDTCTEAFL